MPLVLYEVHDDGGAAAAALVPEREPAAFRYEGPQPMTLVSLRAAFPGASVLVS